MKQKFVRFIREHALFAPGDHIVVGVSGGADSVCLLQLLYEIQEEWGLSLSVVHIDHGIRGQEARDDAAYTEQLAERMSLPFFLVKKNVPELARELGKTEEEAGRELRYQEFERIRKEQGADWIAVAHHEDDQAETILFQVLRGSGVRGLSGMAPRRERIVRPLLGMTRREIEEYLQREQLLYRQDSTNEDTSYSRNYIRKELLPQLEQRLNQQVVRHLAEMAGDVRQWREFIESRAKPVAKRIIRREEDGISLEIEELLKEEKVIQDEVLRSFFSQGIKGTKDILRIHYRQVHELLHKETGKRLELPGRSVIERRYDKLFMITDTGEEKGFFYLECDIPSENIVNVDGENNRITLTVRNRADLPQEIPQKDYTKWFDYDKIECSLVLRNPCEGDFFVLDGEGHRKKLSRYYIDQKIPASGRGRQLVLAEGNKILWTIPGRISADYKVTKSTKHVLVVTRERIHHERGNQGIDYGREAYGED